MKEYDGSGTLSLPKPPRSPKAGEEGPPWFKEPLKDFKGRKCLNGIGPVPADIMFVDHIPTEREVYLRRPYTSRSGQYLVDCLRKVGFDQSKARYTYCVKHVPRKLNAAETKWAKPMFAGEMDAVAPKLVVCFGAEPLKAVVGTQYRWDDVHGAFFVPDTVENCQFTVFATYNIDQVRLSPKYERLFLRDLKLVSDWQHGTLERMPECQNAVIHSPDEVRSFADWLLSRKKQWNLIALDCEWNGRNWMDPERYFRTIQLGYERGKVVTVEISTEGGVPCHPDRDGVFRELKRILEDKNTRIIGHNVIADGEWLLSYGVDIRNNVWYDTMLAEHIIDQNGPFGLETLAMKYTPYGRYSVDVEVWVRRHKNSKLPDTSANGYGFVPRDALLSYGKYDVDVLRYIVDKQFPVLKERGCFKPRGPNGEYPSLFDTSMRTQRVTYDLEMNGLPVDMAQLDMLTERYQAAKSAELSKVMQMARAAGFEDFNPRSSIHLRKMLFGKLGFQDAAPLLLQEYRRFRRDYPKDSFDQGPLLGLSHLFPEN